MVIDPKGDLVTDICARMPDGAEKRTVLIDPEESQAPPIMNVLAGPDPDLVVDNVVGIFRSIFAAFWGPRTDDVLRAACLTLLRTATEAEPVSLAEVPRLLSEESFRRPRVAQVEGDAVGLGGFWKWYESMGDASRAQVVGPVMNKLRAFLLRDFVRQVVGRPNSSFDMGDVLDGGICLVRVPKGVLGDETARLLGSFVVAKVWQTATHRARLGQQARTDAALYVDECQNFLNLPRSFDEMLAEARGYGLVDGAGPPAPGPAAERPPRGGVGQCSDQGAVLHEPRGRSRPLPPRCARSLPSTTCPTSAPSRPRPGWWWPARRPRPSRCGRMPAPPEIAGRLAVVRLAARSKGRPVVVGEAPVPMFRSVPEDPTS